MARDPGGSVGGPAASQGDAAIAHWVKELRAKRGVADLVRPRSGALPEVSSALHRRIDSNPAALAELRALARKGTVTLVYAARDEAHNDAVVLRKVLLACVSG
jgi:uncharacterized protein YeaO (DUF488 family)